MKNLLMIVTVLTLSVSFNSCKKDKQTENLIEKNYFTIQNATYQNSQFPSGSASGAPSIASVFGNNSVLEGGSNPISIVTNSTVKEVLVGVQGKSGYYKINASDLKSTPATYMVYLLFSSNFAENAFDIVIAIVDANGNTSQSQTISVSKVTAGTGMLQISCSWDKENDLDLHLLEPDSTEIYWNEKISASGGNLDVDSNPICYLDNINNENITYSADAVVNKGKYIVKISLFSHCEVTDPTHYVVTARMDGNLITPTSGKNPYYGTVAASHSYMEGDGLDSGDTVMEFAVSAKKSASAGNQKMLKFAYPQISNIGKRSMLYK